MIKFIHAVAAYWYRRQASKYQWGDSRWATNWERMLQHTYRSW
jgi:hypothetical protein